MKRMDKTRKVAVPVHLLTSHLTEPYIPQPDYTPLPARRTTIEGRTAVERRTTIDLEAPLVSSVLPRVPEIKSSLRNAELSEDRVWHNPQWNCSQFPAHEWNAALLKRLSQEAQNRRAEQIRQEADLTVDRFESEIDLYLQSDQVQVEKAAPQESSAVTDSICSSTEGLATTVNSSSCCSTSSSSSSSGSNSNSLVKASLKKLDSSAKRDRDQESLESGYISSYASDAQRGQVY